MMQDFLFPGRSKRTLTLVLLMMAMGGFCATSAVASESSHPIVVAQVDKPSAEGTINAVDVSSHKLKITHGPVVALKWPGMTMNFVVAPDVDLTTVKPGMKISFTLSRGADDKYVIDQIMLVE